MRFASFHADSCPSVAIFLEKTVMKAVQQIRHAKSDDEKAEHLRAEERVKENLAHQPEHARAHHGDAHDGRGTACLWEFLSHCQRPSATDP
jgi:hypothetical protein